MWCFEELEQNLGGRLKSVMILALLSLLSVCLGEIQKLRLTEETALQASSPAEENPIDAYFRQISTENFSEEELYIYTLIYQECWEKELMNAYTLMAQKHPIMVSEKSGLPEAYNNFIKFAQTQGELEKYSGLAAEKEDQGAETELITEQTLNLYEKLSAALKGPDSLRSLFVFSRREAEQMLVRSGIGVS